MNRLKEEKGVALITVSIFMALMLVLGLMALHMSSTDIKTSGTMRQEISNFYGADGGIFAVSGWMTLYKRTDLPAEVLATSDYAATFAIMGNSIRDAEGYSVQWKGMNVKINSQSPPANPVSEVEAVVFVPVAPVGYGNE